MRESMARQNVMKRKHKKKYDNFETGKYENENIPKQKKKYKKQERLKKIVDEGKSGTTECYGLKKNDDNIETGKYENENILKQENRQNKIKLNDTSVTRSKKERQK